jgi:beta-glucosidase
MARECIVLLKNDAGTLPLRKDLKKVLVVGPTAVGMDVLLSNYNGFSDRLVTPLEAIVGACQAGTQVEYVEGCALTGTSTAGFGWALSSARDADVVIACMGLTARLEGEEGAAAESDAGGDRRRIGLPGVQEELLQQLVATGRPVVLVLTSGSAVAIPWAAANVPAIVAAWYGGEQGGQAVADVLFGDYNPAGRLPVTFVKSLDQLPPFAEYALAGRTYRFLRDEPLYRFGYGLSYTTFAYANVRLSKAAVGRDEPVTVTAEVTNTGRRAGEEVVQLYVRDVAASVPVPLLHLEGFQRIHLVPGQTRTVAFTLQPAQLAAYDDQGRPFVEPGRFVVSVGGGQPGDPASGAISTELTVA